MRCGLRRATDEWFLNKLARAQVYLSQTMGNGCEYPIGLAVDDTNALLFWSVRAACRGVLTNNGRQVERHWQQQDSAGQPRPHLLERRHDHEGRQSSSEQLGDRRCVSLAAGVRVR